MILPSHDSKLISFSGLTISDAHGADTNLS